MSGIKLSKMKCIRSNLQLETKGKQRMRTDTLLILQGKIQVLQECKLQVIEVDKET